VSPDIRILFLYNCLYVSSKLACASNFITNSNESFAIKSIPNFLRFYSFDFAALHIEAVCNIEHLSYHFHTLARRITSNSFYEKFSGLTGDVNQRCAIGKVLGAAASAVLGVSTSVNMDKPGTSYPPTGSKIDCEEPYIPAKHVVDDDSSSSRTSTKEHRTFLTEGLNDFYVPIDKYEGRHRYDLDFCWEEYEEKKLVRKVRGDFGSKIRRTVLILLLRSTSAFAPGSA
jgi:hypothetical protein